MALPKNASLRNPHDGGEPRRPEAGGGLVPVLPAVPNSARDGGEREKDGGDRDRESEAPGFEPRDAVGGHEGEKAEEHMGDGPLVVFFEGDFQGSIDLLEETRLDFDEAHRLREKTLEKELVLFGSPRPRRDDAVEERFEILPGVGLRERGL